MDSVRIDRLGAGDIAQLRALNVVFAQAFEDRKTYLGTPPDETYLMAALASPDLIALAASQGDEVIGGLVAYVLTKLEQARAEVYIYDLAVAETHRRQGVATALIEALKPLAREAGAGVIFVQADHDDPPAIALYETLGVREHVLNFDIAVDEA